MQLPLNVPPLLMFFFYLAGHLSFEELEIERQVKLSHDQAQLNSG